MESPLLKPYNLLYHHQHHIEMQVIALERISSYTSLKDLLLQSPPPPSTTGRRKDSSWREIPIKDPLLQHAAWAYLQPMGVLEADNAERWWTWRRVQEKWCRLLGCFNDVVLVLFDWWFYDLARRIGE